MSKIYYSLALTSFMVACGPTPPVEPSSENGVDYASHAVIEASIASIQSDLAAGKMSCLNVVNAYIERIETYDQPSELNAITYKNYVQARKQARLMDDAITAKAPLPALHCVPILAKDNMDVAGFPTTAGSKAMLENHPPDDAHIIKTLKDNGAIILAKTNMAEWAFSPRRTKSTSAGVTKNTYNLAHVPAGSSGGTASGVAASFALAGLGTDTGNSVRGPSSHLALVGMRSTHGLISLDGIVPLVLSADVVGPMTRSVADNAALLTAMPHSLSDKPVNYLSALDKDGLKGARIAVIAPLAPIDDMNPEIAALFKAAITDLRAAGATVLETAEIKDIDAHLGASWSCLSFRKDVHEYLTQPGMNAPISDPYEAFEAGVYGDYTKGAWNWFKDGDIDVARKKDGTICGDLEKDDMRQNIRRDILDAMEAQNLDALIYPSWRYPPASLYRAEEDYKGDNSQSLAPPTGLPALTVPMGFTTGDLPAGLQFLGGPYSEATLYKLSYAYEQATQHRRAPFGALESEP